MSKESMTARQHATILGEYLREGKTVKDFCREHGVRYRYASGLILRFKIPHNHIRSRRFTDRMIQGWIRDYKRGNTLNQIAAKACTTTTIVSAYLQAYEVHDYRARLPFVETEIDLHVYKAASREAAEYWSKRSPTFYKYWKKEIEDIEREARGAQIAGANG